MRITEKKIKMTMSNGMIFLMFFMINSVKLGLILTRKAPHQLYRGRMFSPNQALGKTVLDKATTMKIILKML